jgi:regulator of protease activity HflC (stomatin/prohibitin superfamily)
MQNIARPRLPITTVIVVVILFVALLLLYNFSSQFFYFFERVNEDEVGVQFQSGRINDVVGPGVYSDVGLFVEIKRVPSQAVAFTVTDEELITKDKQRIGLVVTGDIFRPGVGQKELLKQHWAQYNQLYLDDVAVQQRISDRARQAMKVCVGDRIFDEAVIGSARDALRSCIDDEVSELAKFFGLEVENVAVPEVIISPEVQAGLDAIVQRRLQTEQAAQEELKAKAEAAAEQARQEGEIRVAQSRIQEEARQQKTLAELEQEKIVAQRAVIEAERANELARVEAQRAIIEAEKNNELLAAQRELEIQTLLAQAAVERAKAEVAVDLAEAQIFAANPAYLQLHMVQANANALRATDKVIFTPEGTTPTLVLPGPGISPILDVTPAQEAENQK